MSKITFTPKEQEELNLLSAAIPSAAFRVGEVPRKTARKPQAKRPESDPEEYARFLETARGVGASDDPAAFDKAFNKIAL